MWGSGMGWRAALVLALLLGAALLVAPSHAQTTDPTCPAGSHPTTVDNDFEGDYYIYRPSKAIKKYRHEDFEASTDYAIKVLKDRAAPVAIVGVLFSFCILFWACCRCCCKGCHINQRQDVNRGCRLSLFVAAIGLVAGCLVMCIMSLHSDREQSHAIKAIPETVDLFLNFPGEALNASKDLVLTIEYVTNNLTELSTLYPDPDIQELQQLMQQVEDEINDAIDQIQEPDFDDIRSRVHDVTRYDRDRSQWWRVIFGFFFALLFVATALAMWNAFAPATTFRPKDNPCCQVFSTCISITSLVVLFVLWIVAAAVLFLSTVSSDFCYEPTENFLKVGKLENEDVARFFTTCGTNATVRNCYNPFYDEINDLQDVIQTAQEQWSSLEGQIKGSDNCGGNQQLCEVVHDIDASINVLENKLNRFITMFLGCKTVNERYQAVVKLGCENFGETICYVTGIIMGLAICFALAELVTRFLHDLYKDLEFYQPVQSYVLFEDEDPEQPAEYTAQRHGKGSAAYRGPLPPIPNQNQAFA
ncbi:uncharacterized protein MONBRDRAFT_31079 [Monosiga brevicollis MX1]|uniref:Uncharacterized protein n=1 Tax=Monosiga brevicollis TaxID=81824 RepID=A9UNK8_MONBE|nr:uncharacterized protein MONBRDRAFT_31079 [Monosiga brevicollis MX1]EDQ92713.1 predicted protein [Monosiga brevicollis MX1]|eukprot:XP_001742475.1 hypothetical protein [Monosiga brevicollis MX1]